MLDLVRCPEVHFGSCGLDFVEVLDSDLAINRLQGFVRDASAPPPVIVTFVVRLIITVSPPTGVVAFGARYRSAATSVRHMSADASVSLIKR